MPLEDILKKIRDESEKAVKEILEDAEARSQNRLEGARAEAEARASSVLADVKAQAEKGSVGCQDTGRREAAPDPVAGETGAYRRRLQRHLSHIPAADSTGAGPRFSCPVGWETNRGFGSEDRERLGPGFVDELNRHLTSRGKAGAVKVEYSDRSLGGGYLLQSGGVSLNTTFPALMKRYQDELEIEVARLLFS